MLKKTDQSCRR